MIKGMHAATSERLVKARQDSGFTQLQDMATRAALDRHDLAILAESGALRGLAGHRHRARWEVAAVECRGRQKTSGPFLPGTAPDPDASYEKRALAPLTASIRPPSEADDIRTDYASTGLSLGRHPIALLRPQLRQRRALPAAELIRLQHGSRARACGLVTMRQRPMTASGTLFLTLEDETGCVNVVIWPRLWEKQRAEILAANVLAIDGVMETDGDVHHLIASRAHDFSHLADGLETRSRDFH
jgi:error-prone DNA polymerase